MTVQLDARIRFMQLVADASAPINATLFARAVLDDWGISDLAEQTCAGLRELVEWILGHGANALLEVTLVWDSSLLFTEVADHGEQLPEDPPPFERESEDRGAERTDRGRCIWVSHRTGRSEMLLPSAS